MSIVFAGLDVHRSQITFDALDTETGEIGPAGSARRPRRSRSGRSAFQGAKLHVALEACTGWYFVVRALQRAGAVAHLAEVTETRALRGRKRPRQDRSRRCALAAHAARGGQVAGSVDRA